MKVSRLLIPDALALHGEDESNSASEGLATLAVLPAPVPKARDRGHPSKAAVETSGTQMAVPILAAVVDLHSDCLSEHPLAALDRSYQGLVAPGDIGRAPKWLETLANIFAK